MITFHIQVIIEMCVVIVSLFFSLVYRICVVFFYSLFFSFLFMEVFLLSSSTSFSSSSMWLWL